MAQVPASEATAFWTDEKHVHFLNSMEASFVRTMLQNQGNSVSTTRHSLPLDRYLPDSSESTLDLKPNPRRRTIKHHAPSDSMGPTTRRTRRRSSQPYNSSQDQAVPQVENEREGAACNWDDDKRAEN
ncbi:hypothetical protein AAZX31_16G173300 [Glycine max]|uniref:Uncharacterized protein n=2 Tax=Glycine subgen. Soja TaxID=1462606 RepID=K7MIJ7_SOYBN|nr:uncharacterized protein LOC100811730 [Glycine max]XP_028206712.1 uncharacterized protein LOC114390208 [Glycine soja]KAG4939699.1 hypothetical protein JHK86_045840 [Glycine max]KAG4941736.1 hypothetical protein JHK87_045607 [Glycine soja]KAG4952530.1 hypothetical protein JHK85_046397 [Glycine max]KAG5100369.1 hypothetical protein JHK82_045421 [Glycine max]KAG5108956.1 hypothetical protein JHK84_045863 [Glycine max]|eukprot:XP_003548208.1 uncharacterized protein LOC100811730 [Glycine max]